MSSKIGVGPDFLQMRRMRVEFAAAPGGDTSSKEGEFSIATVEGKCAASVIERFEGENSGADRSPAVAIISGCAHAWGVLSAGTL